MRRPLLIALAALAWIAAAVALVKRFRGQAADQPAEGVVSARALDTMTRDELYELARERDIQGRSKMKKDELLAALENRS